MSMVAKVAAVGLFVVAGPAWADSPFDGTWKVDLSTAQITGKPERFQVKNGTYSCQTCQPTPYSIPADGQYHRVAGRPYWDELSVTPNGDNAATFSFKKGGRVISTNTMTVSADGRTLTSVSHNTNNGGNVPVDATSSMIRVGTPMAGAHAISGAWQPQVATSVSDAALTMKMRLTGNQFHQEIGLGETLDATIGGSYAVNVGDPGKTMTKVERAGPRALRFTDMRGGRVINIQTLTVAADGKSIASIARDPTTGNTTRGTALRQ